MSKFVKENEKMNMKKKLFLSACLSLSVLSVFGWGQKGHDTVAYIAQQHLTDATRQAVDSILDGYSLVYWANWLDNASHTADYAYTKTWHYMNIDEGKAFEKAPRIKEGDIVRALNEQIEVLNDPATNKDEKALALKMVTHFLGDIHQPLHMGHASDRGGNYWKIQFFKGDTNLHSVWDSRLVETAHKWSHTEWQEEIDRLTPEQQVVLIEGGTPEKWGEETYRICTTVYEKTPQYYNVEYDYIADWTPTIEQQLLKGGLRLADVLNSVFDPSYQPLNAIVKR